MDILIDQDARDKENGLIIGVDMSGCMAIKASVGTSRRLSFLF